MQGEASDPDAVASALLAVLTDGELRDTIAVNGQSRAVRQDLLYGSSAKWLSMLALVLTATPAERGGVVKDAAAAAAAAAAALEAGGA